MSKNSRKEYLISIKKRYAASSKQERKVILNEFCSTCGYNRKYSIRILNSKIEKKNNDRHPSKKKYEGDELEGFLIKTWKASNLPCGKRLKPIIKIWLPKYLESGEKLGAETINLLNQISAATIDRIFKPIRHRYKKRGLCTTKPGSIIRELVPIRTNQWDENRAGFMEADTIAHCGGSIAGMFVYSVNMIDIATGWSTQRATWGKGESGVMDCLQSMESSLPFKIRGFDCDNGGEFLNWEMLKYFKHRKFPVEYTRSRAYHKNDNAHIEGKNWTLIRQYF
ncbi:MAG: integrase, partial [Ignavibacteria bacterium]